jgi:AraC-like DNA-binding protein
MINHYEAVKAHPEYFKQLKCKELLFAQYDCPQEVSRQDFFCEHNFIAYVMSGKRTFDLPGESHVMTEGKCVFSKKGAWIAEKEPEEGWCVLVFYIPDNYLKQFVHESRVSLSKHIGKQHGTKQMIDLEVNEITKRFFHSIIPYFDQNSSVPESLLELKFKELLFSVLINPANENLLAWMYTLADSIKQPLQQIMEANYAFNLSLKDYAKISNRSLVSFKREFSIIYQTTPGKWLLQKRLDYARLLLNTSTKNINEITFDSGFENPSHFSRLFKNKFGITPSNFRHQNN